MSFARPKLVLFDLDGTLVDSAPDLAFSIDAMLSSLGRPACGESRVRDWIGSGAERLVKRALTGDGEIEPDGELFRSAFGRFSESYGENPCRRSRLYPGVREGLDYLLASGMQLGCVTNKRGRFTEPLLAALGLLRDFAIVVSGDTLCTRKPDPAPLLHAVEALGIGPGKTLMVGDSVNDVFSARAACVPVICVRYGYHNGEDIVEARPDAIIDSLAELSDFI